MSTKVQCPICDRTVPEADINLHLDLLCRGAGGPSSPVATPSSSLGRKRPSQEEDDVVALDTKPAKLFRSRPGAGDAGSSSASQAASATQGQAGTNGTSSAVKRTANERGGTEKRRRVNALTANQPLAERSRPSSLETFVGQGDLVGPGSLLRARIEAGEGAGSCILWGPPGSGKTTLARLIARTANADFRELSATSSGSADVRQVFEQAKNGLQLTGRKTILFIDEIHRFNKPQQDLFLPYVENGWVQLIGATTENPSFKVNGALLSRCQVFTLRSYTPEELETILQNALDEVENKPRLPPALLPLLAEVADGDARQALNGLELALKVCEMGYQTTLTEGEDSEAAVEARERRDAQLMDAVRRGLRKGYDRSGEERYDMISAMHKSLRGSDGSAAMYWLARMLTGGEDPLYVARRLVVVASEDVGLADPHALPLAMATFQACQVIGMPECRINLAHCVAYLAEAPKSTRAYTAYARAEALAQKPPLPPVPMQVRNAPTRLMKTLGYGSGYAYNPGYAHPVWNEYLPPHMHEMSSHAPSSEKQILRSADEEMHDKAWDEDRLKEWEELVNGREKWPGREEGGKKGKSPDKIWVMGT